MKKLNLYIATLAAVSLFVAAPCFGLVSGTVTDTLGNSVSGAVVTFTNEADSTLSFTATTDADGRYQISITTSVNENHETSAVPAPFILMQNYPNPFNPSTVIPFTLSVAGRVSLTVYNIQGQMVGTLLDGNISAGEHSVRWNGLDNRGRPVSAGVYLYQLRVGGRSETKKMLLLDGGDKSISGGSFSVSVRNGFQKGSGKIAGTTYRVTIIGDDIVTYQERGILLTDGGTYNFSVIRRTVIAGVTFVSIPGGTFQMGDEFGDMWIECRPVHTVTVSGFEMSVYEITNAQYAQFLNDALKTGDITATSTSVKGAKGAYNGHDYIYLSGYWPDYPDARCWITYSNNTFSVVAGHENWPVMWVTWYGSKAFALYYGLDLPTESEWEYACRGGEQYKYGTDDGTLSTSKAKYWGTGINHPVAVGSYPKNPFGLYDMSGNVFEWCADWYGNYTSGSQTDPTGAQTGSSRVLRGGSWHTGASHCRSAFRGGLSPDFRDYYIGFRVGRRVSP